MSWISQVWLLFQALAAKTRQKGIKVTKPEDQNYRIEMNWISQVWLLFQALAAKTCPKEIKLTKPEDQNNRIEMNWIRQIWLLFQSLAAKTRQKGIKVTKPENQNYRNWNELNQPDLITFSIFGSQNPSKSNQSHQTRRSELSNWNGLNQPNLITFSSFGSQNLSKRNQNIWNRCMYSWAVSRVRSGPGPVPVRDRVCGKPGVPWVQKWFNFSSPRFHSWKAFWVSTQPWLKAEGLAQVSGAKFQPLTVCGRYVCWVLHPSSNDFTTWEIPWCESLSFPIDIPTSSIWRTRSFVLRIRRRSSRNFKSTLCEDSVTALTVLDPFFTLPFRINVWYISYLPIHFTIGLTWITMFRDTYMKYSYIIIYKYCTQKL